MTEEDIRRIAALMQSKYGEGRVSPLDTLSVDEIIAMVVCDAMLLATGAFSIDDWEKEFAKGDTGG